MKKFLIILAVVIVGFLIYKYAIKKEKPPKEKPVPVAVSKYSTGFNKSIGSILTVYYAMADGFVNWDTAVVGLQSGALKTTLDNFNTEELKKDSTIYQTVQYPLELARTNTDIISTAADWTERRRALNDLSDNIRSILLAVKYDQAPVYWQECPMAFEGAQSGNWLSATREVINPYLGNKDPKYGKTMLNCGENKMTIDFTAKDTTVAE